MYMLICWYLCVLPVLNRPEVVDIGVNTIYGDLCKHLGIDLSTDLDDRYSNLFLNAYINHQAHTEYLKMIEVYSPLGIWHVFL